MPPKVIQVGLLTAVRTIDPHDAGDTQSTLAAAQIYESGCTVPADEGPVQLVLFRSLEQLTPYVWTAVLRQDVTFSDGTPLTAEIAAAAYGRTQFIRQQATVEAKGERLIFTLRAPNPRFDQALTRHQCAITFKKGQNLIGTGAFLPARDSTPQALHLVRNERHRSPTVIDEIVFQIYPPDPAGRPTTLLEAISRGAVDFTSALSRADAAGIPRVRTQASRANSTAVLFFNTERPALANPQVRRAMALAIDRLAIAEVSFAKPLAHVANGLLPPMLGSLRDDLTCDVAKAKELLASVRGSAPTRLTLVGHWPPRPYLPNPNAAASLVAKQLSGLGLEVQVVVPTNPNELYDLKCAGKYDLLLTGWIADMADPVDYLEALLGSTRIPNATATGLPCANSARLRNTELDATLAHLRSDRNPSDYTALQKILSDQITLVPIMYGANTAVATWRLKNLEITPLGIPLFGTVTLQD